jgi:hypothetical protein
VTGKWWIFWTVLLGAASVASAADDASFGGAPARSTRTASHGGQFFARRLELPVRDLEQEDPRWTGEFLGPTQETLGDEGCALTSVAMVLNYYGVRCDPLVLNRFLTAHGGFDPEGYLDFDRVTAFAPQRVRFLGDEEPSFAALDGDLLAGQPVILQLTLWSGDRHFVVVVGKQGWDYLVRDPAAEPRMSLVTLGSLAARVERQFLYTGTARR